MTQPDHGTPPVFRPSFTVRVCRREIVEYEVIADSYEDAYHMVQGMTKDELEAECEPRVCEAEEYICDEDGDPVEADD